jgi:cytochrome P450
MQHSSWLVYLLSLHPEVGDNFLEELLLIVEDNKTSSDAYATFNGELTQFASSLLSYDVISKLHFLHAAYTKTLCLYPAVPWVLRQFSKKPHTVVNRKVLFGSLHNGYEAQPFKNIHPNLHSFW